MKKKWKSEKIIQEFLKRHVKEKSMSMFAKDFILSDLLQTANSLSKSTGAELSDYLAIFEYIRKYRPNYVLECGTGKTTWFIAEAMSRFSVGEKKLISMEHNKEWFEHARKIFPSQLKEFTEICYSPMDQFSHSFIRGTVYREIPEFPYQFVFIDGPDQEFFHPDGKKENLCNMDLIRLVQGSENPITAFVDNRRHTVLAYSMIFKPPKVTFYEHWDLGVVKSVTSKDLILNDKNTMNKNIFRQLANFAWGNPF